MWKQRPNKAECMKCIEDDIWPGCNDDNLSSLLHWMQSRVLTGQLFIGLMASHRVRDFLLLFLFILFITASISTAGNFIFLALGGLWVTSLFAWSLTEPLGQTGLGPLAPVLVLVFPHGLEHLSSDNFPATLIQLLSVAIGSGVGTSLILGEHADLGWVFACESLRVESLLDGLVSELDLLSFLQFLKLIILSKSSLFIVIFVGLKGDNGVPQSAGFALQLIRVHGIEVKGLDTDAQRGLHLLLNLFLGVGHLSAGIKGRGLLFLASLLLLGGHHLLPLALSLLEPLLFLLSLLGLLLGLFLPQFLLLFPLLHGKLLFLLSSDFLPLGLFVLHPLELFLLLGPLFSPLIDVFLQLLIELTLLGAMLGLGKRLISLL